MAKRLSKSSDRRQGSPDIYGQVKKVRDPRELFEACQAPEVPEIRPDVIIMAGGRGERFWPDEPRGDAEAADHAALEDAPSFSRPWTACVPLVPIENILIITNAVQAPTGAEAAAEAAEGKRDRRAGRPRHLRAQWRSARPSSARARPRRRWRCCPRTT
jgi:hypothetical protein